MADFLLPLSDRRGNVTDHAVIDAADAPFAMQWTWRCNRKHGQYPYAERYESARGGIVLLHRELLGDAPFDGAEVDHVDWNGLNNRRTNLRWVTHAQNMQNRRGPQKNNTSGYRGVIWDRRSERWYGQVKRNGRKVWLRYFDNVHDAGAAVAAARKELMPFATA